MAVASAGTYASLHLANCCYDFQDIEIHKSLVSAVSNISVIIKTLSRREAEMTFNDHLKSLV